ncbi:endolytic transglycosylase MltG [Aliikangiella coralliicola]|uniref:Endolytic murein transglycosylase n=1 Tax=Aliikangiella coralliicola TaxID=2592383 RepID=A0A545UD53_9GAMM|nr:endolytic transglycosylase MltG [Aliikangiella coralliicola]TQV87392.1 endolytic transglycosylase MltG [Aliikangiella coralliicola]
MNLKKIISIRFLFGAVLFALFLTTYWHWSAYKAFLQTRLNFAQEQNTLVVKPGHGINWLAYQWQQQGVIDNQYYLRFLCWLNPEYKNIKVGEYELEGNETPISLMQKLSEGMVIQYPFTIVEGTTSFDIFKQLNNTSEIKKDWPKVGKGKRTTESQNELSSAESNQQPFDEQALLIELKIEHPKLEGWLFPDTYHYGKNTSAMELLKRSVARMRKILKEEWSNRAPGLPYQNEYEALIMASIIEKETGIESEREQIAGVFVRRLQKNMRLQTDPTVIYGIGPSFNGDITYKDLRTRTPYNTYVIKGLPPTPIAMAGQASIHAALNPADGDALYFVATGDGGHKFSATLEEHNKALKEYLRKLRQKNN